MMTRWHTRAGLGLLLLALAGLAAPAAAALSSDSCCAAMEAGAKEAGVPVPCQWIVPTSCCNEVIAPAASAAFVPPPAGMSFAPVFLPAPQRDALAAGADGTTSHRRALATVFLRL